MANQPAMPSKSIFTRPYRDMIKRLIQARKKAGLSQIEVAKALRWGQSAVSKMERGERRIDPIELQRIARLYKTKAARLLGER